MNLGYDQNCSTTTPGTGSLCDALEAKDAYPHFRGRFSNRLLTFALSLLAALGTAQPGAAADLLPATSILFVLDCSKSMGAAFAPRNDVTRLERAQELLDEQMQAAAAAGNCRVGLYCLGHRLRWQDGVANPDLQEQDGYLQASLGYGALRTLLPGDDIERLLAIRPFDETQIALLVPRLHALQAWGERPLNSALIKALDDLSSESTSGNRAIVVLTDGGRAAAKTSSPVSHEMVMDTLKRCLTPIYVVDLGDAAETELAHAQLRELAEFAGGAIVKAPANETIRLASLLKPSQLATAEKLESDGASAAHDRAPARRPASYRVLGKIVYNGQPASSAKLSLKGANQAPTKADSSGRFLFTNVPPGRYELKIEAIAKGKIRKRSEWVNLEDAQPGEIVIDLK